MVVESSVPMLSAVFGLIMTMSGAFACDGSRIAFEDKFETLDPAWPTTYGGMKADAGHLKLRVTENELQQDTYSIHSLNQANVYNDANICAIITFASVENAKDKTVGVLFWGLNDTSYYGLLLSPVGQFTVVHRVGDTRFLYPIPWAESLAIPKVANKAFEVQVSTKGNTATFYLDNQKIGELKGQAPADGQLVGLSAGMSVKEKSDQFIVDDFRVKQ